MENSDILVAAALAAILAFRLYQKHLKKKQSASGANISSSPDSKLSGKDDDYEPYSKK
jgi:hypothetical protein